jgi:peroxiredoxin
MESSLRFLGILYIVSACWVARAADIPRQSPELSIKLVDGRQILLSQYRGKVVILEFLLTYCKHCQDSSRVLNKLYSQYGPQGLQPVGAAINDMATLYVPQYVRRFEIAYPIGIVPRETAVQFLQHPVVVRMMMPQLVIIDRKGVIRAQYSGDSPLHQNEERNLRAIIEPLLREGTQTSTDRGQGETPRRGRRK